MKIKLLKYITILILFSNCTARISSHVADPNIHLAQHYRKISIICNREGNPSVTTTTLFEGQISQTNLLNSSSALRMAFETLSFELEKMGFQVVNPEAKPDLFFELYISDPRFDSMAGWIADKGFLTIRETKSNKVIARFQAKTFFITPTVENIIDNLISEIEKHY